MSVYPSVIVGTDGSTTAAEAVRRSAALADALGTSLLVLSAFTRPDPDELGPPSQRAGQSEEALISPGYRGAAATVVDAAALVARAYPNVEIDTATPEGDPADVLLSAAEARPGALLAIGSQGMTGSRRFLLGSVPNKVSHHMVGDVVIWRTGQGREIHVPGSVLVGTDGSATAGRAVERAAELAAAVGAALTILTVTSRSERGEAVVADAAGAVEGFGVQAATVVRAGDPAEALVAESAGHDLLVVGSQGMTGAQRFLLGNVPNKVSHHASSDLLIVKTDVR